MHEPASRLAPFVQCDEEPLYIFDPTFAEAAPELLRSYQVPSVFDQDLLGVLGECCAARCLVTRSEAK